MIKVIRGHVVKELVTNPVNGINELVLLTLVLLIRDKVHKRSSRELWILCGRRLLLCHFNTNHIRDVENSKITEKWAYREMLRTHYNDTKTGVKWPVCQCLSSGVKIYCLIWSLNVIYHFILQAVQRAHERKQLFLFMLPKSPFGNHLPDGEYTTFTS